MKRTFVLVLVAFAGVWPLGCSPADYRRSADRQVEGILRDRKTQILEYQPQSEAPATMPTTPPAKAYTKVPATPIPPAPVPPMEPVRVEVPYGPLGPRPGEPEADGLNQSEKSLETARRQARQRLELGPPAPGVSLVRFDLFGAIAYAVEHSRSYQDRMEDLYLSALDVTLERHLFTPRPFAGVGVTYTGGAADVDYRAATTVTNRIGVRQQLPYGGEIIAQGLVDFVQTVNGAAADGESAQVALSASVPLLRGAGMVNLEPLIQSERRLVYAVRDFETYRRSFVVDIASRYFNLLTQQQSIANRRSNYLSRAALTERTEALFEAGRMRFDRVQLAQQAQLQAENALITAQDSYQSALDSFKILVGMPVEVPLDVVGVELQVSMPEIDREDVVQIAQKYRLDLQTARDQIEDAQRGVQTAENGLLPDLDFIAQTNVGNRENTPAARLDSRSQTWSAGVSLDLPLDRVSERNTYRRSLITLERAQRNFITVQDRITADVRDAVRSIRQAQSTLQIQRLGIELAQKRVEYTTELLVKGSGDARDVADAQDALLSAQDAFDRARSDLQIQILRFLRDTGTLRLDSAGGALAQAMDRGGAAETLIGRPNAAEMR